MSIPFENRHIGLIQTEKDTMLRIMKKSSVDELISEVIPKEIKHDFSLNLPSAISEEKYLTMIQEVAKENQLNRSFIGQGYYQTSTPSVIKRMVFENPGWYTQ